MLPYARKSKRMKTKGKKVKRELMMRRYCVQEGCMAFKGGTITLLSLEILLLNIRHDILGGTVHEHLYS